MEVACKNIQKELNDVNNFWRWPVEQSTFTWSVQMGSIIELPVLKWFQYVEGNGTVIAGNWDPAKQKSRLHNFGDGFIELERDPDLSTRPTYSAGVFLPSRHNGIDISYDIDEVPFIRGAYFMHDNGKWTYAKNSIPSFSYDGKIASYHVDPLDSSFGIEYAYLMILNAELGKEIVRIENIKISEA